jgi:hypothetical protein
VRQGIVYAVTRLVLGVGLVSKRPHHSACPFLLQHAAQGRVKSDYLHEGLQSAELAGFDALLAGLVQKRVDLGLEILLFFL